MLKLLVRQLYNKLITEIHERVLYRDKTVVTSSVSVTVRIAIELQRSDVSDRLLFTDALCANIAVSPQVWLQNSKRIELLCCPDATINVLFDKLSTITWLCYSYYRLSPSLELQWGISEEMVKLNFLTCFLFPGVTGFHRMTMFNGTPAAYVETLYVHEIPLDSLFLLLFLQLTNAASVSILVILSLCIPIIFKLSLSDSLQHMLLFPSHRERLIMEGGVERRKKNKREWGVVRERGREGGGVRGPWGELFILHHDTWGQSSSLWVTS